MKNKIYLVTDSLDVIQKIKTLVESNGFNLDIDLQVFSKLSWSENLENPFLRSSLMDKPMLLPGGLNELNRNPYEAGSVSVNGLDIDQSNIHNVVDFPKTGRVSGQVVSMDQIEKAAIIQAIEACQGNLSLAAKSLGLGRATLYRKLKNYSIEPKEIKNKSKRKVA
jgi:transcriptional regulator with GAF, ATPase, and Fis domain